MFRNAQRGAGLPPDWNDVDRKLSDAMTSYWVNFITKGDPNGPGLPHLAAVQGHVQGSRDRPRRYRAARDRRAGGEVGVLQRRARTDDEGRRHELASTEAGVSGPRLPAIVSPRTRLRRSAATAWQALAPPDLRTLAPSHPRTLAPSHLRTFAPSHLRTLASHLRTLAPPRTFAPSHPRTLAPHLGCSILIPRGWFSRRRPTPMKRAILVGALGSILAIVPSAWAAITDPVKTETGQLSGTSTATRLGACLQRYSVRGASDR